MSVRVLVVDDSRFFRRRVKEMLESDPLIQVVGEAENGSVAVDKAGILQPNVITMDIEMPVMDGIEATRKILSVQRIPILMFSSLTTEGAQATFDALDAGAIDYLPKRFEDIAADKLEARKLLCDKIKAVVKRRPMPTKRLPSTSGGTVKSIANFEKTDFKSNTINISRKANTNAASASESTSRILANQGRYKLIVIGTSTGGPVALQKILSKLPKHFSQPLLLVQHMPGSFTGAFAQRLDSCCAIHVREAVDGDELKAGVALLAPGGKQMEFKRSGISSIVRISDATEDQNYKPCVDITFSSVAKEISRQTLAIILTGMGSDGCEGAKLLKSGGATVWAQDEASCVVYGMPAAVADSGIVDNVFSLDDIGANLAQGV
ncbi:MAG: chemotaxis response regulator protein-glutamate methylesterase [Gammaproteobacteria bacterium]|nr:chemotaxis response regulator protein-glutamate methylesterase [Gammaproteobacteria bacterium]